MKKQVLFVHGGHAGGTHEEHLERLRTSVLRNIFANSEVRWHQTLRSTLGSEYEVCTPLMPNKYNARYEEWKIWFERHVAELHDGVVLIGHSLGGILLAKYLSENILPIKIKSLHFVAAVITYEGRRESGLTSFTFDTSQLNNLSDQILDIHVYHSKDDAVVPYDHALKYNELLQGSHLHTFEERGHFLQETFPELVEEIRGLE